MSTLINERQAARRLGYSVWKLQKDRIKGIGVPYHKMGRTVRYCPTELETYIAQCRRTSTSQEQGGKNG